MNKPNKHMTELLSKTLGVALEEVIGQSLK